MYYKDAVQERYVAQRIVKVLFYLQKSEKKTPIAKFKRCNWAFRKTFIKKKAVA